MQWAAERLGLYLRMRMTGSQECVRKNNLKPCGKGRGPGCCHVPLLEGCCSQLRSDPGKARTPQGKQVKIISFKEVGGKVEPLEKGTGRKIKNLTPGHLEEELTGLKYKSELLVMNDVVVSTDDLGMIQEKETE